MFTSAAAAAASNGSATGSLTNGLTIANSHQPQQPGGHSFATGHQVNDIMMGGPHHLTAGPHKLRV